MSNLERVAARVLKPFILGQEGVVSEDDAAAIATWTQKTVLVGMLVSSEDDRAGGYGLPAEEYRGLYALRQEVTPLPASQLWIGRYEGERKIGAIWATPMVVGIDGVSEPDVPQGYAMTVVLGDVLLHGFRFTTPGLQFELEAADGFARVWPPVGVVTWPCGTAIDDDAFVSLSKGRGLRSLLRNVALAPWRPATDLPQGGDGPLVRLPTPCGEHFVFYPTALAEAGLMGKYSGFVTSCECGTSYLVRTEADGAHFKAEGGSAPILEAYESLPGEEFVIDDGFGRFVFKMA